MNVETIQLVPNHRATGSLEYGACRRWPGPANNRKRCLEDDDNVEDTELKPVMKRRAESYEETVPNTDWVLSLTAPYHVATSKASFSTYTEFESVVRFGRTGTHKVLGVGDVQYDGYVSVTSEDVNRVLMHDVLHIPGLQSNIHSVTRSAARGFTVSINEDTTTFSRNGRPWSYATRVAGVYRMAMPAAQRRPSKLREGENHLLAFDWQMPERHAWELLKKEKGLVAVSAPEVKAERATGPSVSVRPMSHSSDLPEYSRVKCHYCPATFPSNNKMHQHRRQAH